MELSSTRIQFSQNLSFDFTYLMNNRDRVSIREDWIKMGFHAS